MTAIAKLNVTSNRIQNVRTLRDRRGASGPAMTTGRTDASATVAAQANIGMMTTAWVSAITGAAQAELPPATSVSVPSGVHLSSAPCER